MLQRWYRVSMYPVLIPPTSNYILCNDSQIRNGNLYGCNGCALLHDTLTHTVWDKK